MISDGYGYEGTDALRFWRLPAIARPGGYFDRIGDSPRLLELMAARDSVTEVDVAEVPLSSGEGSYFGWIPAGENVPVMIRCGSDPYRAQFTYGPEAEERRGKGRTVRLRVTAAG